VRSLVVKVPDGNPPQTPLNYWAVLERYEGIISEFAPILDALYDSEYKYNKNIRAPLGAAKENVTTIVRFAHNRISRLKRRLELLWQAVPIAPRKIDIMKTQNAVSDIDNDSPEYVDTYNPLAPRYWQKAVKDACE